MKPKNKILELPPDYEYAMQEYGMTPKQLAAAEKRALREIAADRKAGRLVEFTGSLPVDNPHQKPAMKSLKPNLKQTGEEITIIANERGQLPFPKDYLAASSKAVGDEYACWKTPRGLSVVFPKKSKHSRKIPRHAYRGRIGRWNNRNELIIQAKATKEKI